ncbi:MAG TPA: response regulator [Gemmatimonadales bacterium]|nr:response regulator [Gemmatimonadales bacterium]
MILLVDDEASIRTAVRRALEHAGYEVCATPDGAAATGVWRREGERVEALITDVILGEQNGTALAAEFRRERPDLPVVVISGYLGAQVRQSGGLPPGAHFLEKPFTLDELVETVRTALGERTELDPG